MGGTYTCSIQSIELSAAQSEPLSVESTCAAVLLEFEKFHNSNPFIRARRPLWLHILFVIYTIYTVVKEYSEFVRTHSYPLDLKSD